VYKFHTSRGPGKLPQRGLDGAPAENEFWHILELEKNTPDRHKSIIFDISGRPRGPDRNTWRAGLWPVGRMLGTPAIAHICHGYSVRLSHACIVSKRLIMSLNFFYLLIGPSFECFVIKDCCINVTASPLTGAPDTRGWQFSTNRNGNR